MGREVRMVPADWEHPKYREDTAPHEHAVGRYIPLFDGSYEEAAREWDKGWEKWQEGLVEDYSATGPGWRPVDQKYHDMRYTDYAGSRPSPDGYMPTWPEGIATHYRMYETTSEGTPISPAFETPEALARWLADTGASSFAGMTATYEQWLAVARGGYAPSAVLSENGLESGVAYAGRPE
jgi:hypothetical protein